MSRVPIEIVDFQVALLYAEHLDDKDLKEIDFKCRLIAEFIQACGWDETDYWNHQLDD